MCINLASTGQICFKFDVSDFCENLVKSKFPSNQINMRHITLRPVYIYIAQSSKKYFVAQQHCIGNTWHFHGSRHQFYVVDSDMSQKCKGNTLCFVAKLNILYCSR